MKTAAVISIVVLALSSCVTHIGSSFKDSATLESKQAKADAAAAGPTTATPSSPQLSVRSVPSGADVYIDGLWVGQTPLDLDSWPSAYFSLELRKDGYRVWQTSEFVGSEGQTISANLDVVTGFLQIQGDLPDDIFVDDSLAQQAAAQEVPIGVHTILLRKFGYEDITSSVQILENQTTYLGTSWNKAQFAFVDASLSRASFAPKSPGATGSTKVTFEVTAPGTGDFSVRDAQGSLVFGPVHVVIRNRHQIFSWDGRSSSGEILADGNYQLAFSGTGDDSTQASRSIGVSLDSGLVVSFLGKSGIGSGLLLVPFAETMPAAGGEVSFSAEAQASGGLFRMPLSIDARIGIARGLEVGLGADATLREDTAAWQVGIDGNLKFEIFRAGSLDYRFIVSGLASVLYQTWLASSGYSTLDDAANYPGLGLGLALQGDIGPLTVALAGDLKASTRIYAGSSLSLSAESLYLWLNTRAGIALRAGNFLVGVSAALRSEPFGYGLQFFNPQVLVALEAGYTFPDSGFSLGISAHAVIAAVTNWYVYWGLRLGTIF